MPFGYKLVTSTMNYNELLLLYRKHRKKPQNVLF